MSNLSLTTIVSGSTETTTYNNIADLKAYLNTVKTSGLTSATISGELSESSDFSYLFANSPTLTTINLTDFKSYSYITNLSHFIYNCPNLTSLQAGKANDTTYFNTENVTDMSWAFAWCALEKNAKEVIEFFIDQNYLDKELYIPDYSSLFYYSTPDELKASLSTAFDTLPIYYKNWVVKDLNDLDEGLLSSLGLPTSFEVEGHFDGEAFAEDAIGTASWRRYSSEYTGEFGRVYVYDYCDAELKAILDTIKSSVDLPEALVGYFYDDPDAVFSNRDKFNYYNISDSIFYGFDTSKVTNMQGMFYGCHFNAFYASRGINNVVLDTSKVTDMSYMFAYVPIGCLMGTYYDSIGGSSSAYIQYGIDIRNIDWSKVTDVSYMFEYCTRLKSNSSLYYENGFLAFGKSATATSNFTNCNFANPVKMTGFMRGDFIGYFELPSSTKITDASMMFKSVNVFNDYRISSKNVTIKVGADFSENTSMKQICYEMGKYSYSTSGAYGIHTTIDISQTNLNWSNITDFSEAFYGSRYVTVNIPNVQLNTTDTIDLTDMWTDQTSGTMTLANANLLKDTSCIITRAFCNSPLEISNLNLGETTFVGDTLDFTKLFYKASGLTGDIYLSLVDTTKVISLTDFSTYCGAAIHFNGTPDFSRVTSLENWGYEKTFDELHLEWFRNAEITNINRIFAMLWADSSKESLATVDDCIEALTTNLDLSHVVSAQNLFSGFNFPSVECTMPNISLNLPALTNAIGMFASVGFNASTVITLTAPNLNMYSNMFNYCMFMPGVQVTFPTVPNKSVINTWFSSCYFLDDNGPVALTGLIDSSVTSLNNMFYYCEFGTSDSPISSVDFTNLGWDTSNVTDFGNMFYYASFYCDSINLTGLDFSSATNCRLMLRQRSNSSLPNNINMGDFKAESEVNIGSMFYNYNSSDGWFENLERVVSTEGDVDSYSGSITVSSAPFEVGDNIELFLDGASLGIVTVVDFSELAGTTASGYSSSSDPLNPADGDFTILYTEENNTLSFSRYVDKFSSEYFYCAELANPSRHFVLSEDFDYGNITSWANIGNTQFEGLIKAHASELQSYDGMSFAGTWTYDTFVEEYVYNKHMFTVNEDYEIVIPSQVTNISSMLAGSTLSEGTHDFVINAPGATNVSYLFTSCNCTNMIPRVIAPNAINCSYLYYNFKTTFPVNLAGGMVSTDQTLISGFLSPGTYYLYINIVNGLDSGELGENYVKLDPLTIGGQSVPFVHVKDFYYGLTKDDDSNIWRATGIRRTHTSVFSITLPESAQISFISHAPNALVMCQGSKNPKIDLSGINVSPDSDFINIYCSDPYSSSGVIEYDIHGLDLSEVEGTSNNVTDILGRSGGCNCHYLNASNITLSDKITSLNNIYKTSRQLLEADLSGLSAPGVTTASSMFEDSIGIMCLNVSNWDVPALENLNKFCYRAINRDVINSLGTVDMSGWNAPNLTSMSYMFSSCYYMGDVKFDNMYDFDTSKVTDMSHMFQNCYALTTPNLTWLDLSSCTTIDYMFYDAIMGDLDVHFFDTSHVQSADYTFSYCRANTLNISEWDLSGINKALVDFLSRMPNCTTINMKDFFMPSFTSVGNVFYRDTALQTIIGPIHGESVTLIQRVFEECGVTTFTDDLFDFPNLKVISQLFSYSNVKSATFNQTYDNLQVIYLLDAMGKIETLNLSFTAPELVSLKYAFESLKLSEIDLSNCTFSNKLCDFYGAFYGCENLTNVVFPELTPAESFYIEDSTIRNYTSYSDSGGYANFGGTFYNCESLQSIDLSSIDFSNIKLLSRMFAGSGMTSNDFGISSFPKATNINGIFEDCESLTAIDYSVWNMPSLVEASNVFAGCTPATTVGLTDFINNCKNTLTSISSVYGDATATTIQINDLELLNIIGMNTLLCYAPAMTRYEMENCNFPELTSFSSDTYNSVTSYSFSGTKMPKATSFPKISSTALTSVDYSDCEFPSVTSFSFHNNTNLVSADFSGTDLSGVGNIQYAFRNCTSLTTLDFSGADLSKVGYASNTFENCVGITSMDLSLPSCMSISEIFKGCTNLETVTLRNLQKMYGFNGMCEDCTSLTSIEFVDCPGIVEYSYSFYWNNAFKNCSSLTSIDLSMFDASKASDNVYCYEIILNNMFDGCTNLASVSLPTFRLYPSQPVDCSSMFLNCTSLSSVDMRNLVISYFTSNGYIPSLKLTSAFEGCTNITEVKLPTLITRKTMLGSAFKNCAELTSVVSVDPIIIESSAASTFEGCAKIVTIPALSIISDSTKVSVDSMFKNCTSLANLDLKWFKWDRISAANNMFVGDSALTTIICKEQTAPSTTYSDMFSGCTSLVGNAGTEFEKRYNASDISSAFAQSATGYFTTVPISFFFNGTECSGLFFNGTEIASLYWNGTKVF